MSIVNDIKIRPATPDDTLAISELFQLAAEGVADYLWHGYRDDFPGLSDVEIGAAWFAEDHDDYSYRSCSMVEVNGTVAGMSMAFPLEATPKPLPDDFDPVMRPYVELEEDGSFYVCALGVYEPFRGQGIGTQLLERAQVRAKELNCPSLSLQVFDANAGAKRLYERMGYRTKDRRAIIPHPLIRPEGDVLLMVRPLD